MQVNLTANTDLHTVDDFKQLVIRQQNDALVRLQDVAEVDLGAEDYDTEVRFNGQTAVFMGMFPLPNANTIEVVRRIRTELEGIKKDLPQGLQAGIAYDASEYISNAIHEAAMTRLRPVLMTSVATVAGHFPLTLVDGPGAAARNSIGRVLVGGMTIGTLFTLLVVPALYLLLAKRHTVEHVESPVMLMSRS